MPRQPPLSSALFESTADLIVREIPRLDRGQALELLTQAARTNASLRQLLDHLQEHPDGLRRPRSDAPLALGRIARFLLESGYEVGEPGCHDCGRAAVLPHKIPGGRLCRRCYKRRLTDTCCRCGQVRQIQARKPEGAVCASCYQRDRQEQCAKCGRLSRVATRQPDGQSLCQTCRPNRRQGTCALCGQQRYIPCRARAMIRVALELLVWLRKRGQSLSELRQDDIEDWLSAHPGRRSYLIIGFLKWANNRGLAGKLTVATPPPDDPANFLDDDQRVPERYSPRSSLKTVSGSPTSGLTSPAIICASVRRATRPAASPAMASRFTWCWPTARWARARQWAARMR
jgi:hypothetical protein